MWLLRQEIAERLVRAWERGQVPTAREQAAYEAEVAAQVQAAGGSPRNLKVAGSTAQINVQGILTPKPDLMARWFGGGNTTYEEINQALAIAAADPAIKNVVFYIDSPGGQVAGLFNTLATIQGFEKPKSAKAAFACSAAYGIATAAGKIEATNAAVEVGSVGVAVTYLHLEELIDITSTEAPNKRPDPSTEEGKAIIREHLDAIHDLFATAIAEGRTAAGVPTTVKDVNENFGRGGIVLAKEAKRRGMIDRIAAAPPRAVQVETSDEGLTATEPTATSGGTQTTRKKMELTLEKLKSEFPQVYEAAVAVGFEKGKVAGTEQERDRVTSHLIRGEAAGAMDIAMKAVESGDPVTETYKAKYDTASKSRRALEEADKDDKKVEGAVTNTPPAPEPKDEGDLLADALDRIGGKVE